MARSFLRELVCPAQVTGAPIAAHADSYLCSTGSLTNPACLRCAWQISALLRDQEILYDPMPTLSYNIPCATMLRRRMNFTSMLLARDA